MSRKPSPALAFYLKHPVDFDALHQLPEAPKGVSSEDWSKFVDVRTKASEQAAELLIACREEAMKLFAERFSAVSRRSLEKARENWDAWVELKEKRATPRKNFLFGCCLITDPNGTPVLHSYLYAIRAQDRPDLVERLKEAKLSSELPPSDVSDGNAVTLRLVPIGPESDLDEAREVCVRSFVEVARAF